MSSNGFLDTVLSNLTELISLQLLRKGIKKKCWKGQVKIQFACTFVHAKGVKKTSCLKQKYQILRLHFEIDRKNIKDL